MTERNVGASRPLPAGLFLIASKRTMRGSGADVRPGEFPRYAYWEPPDEPSDSGWRVLVGDESQEDADDPDGFQVNAVETLTTFHPALRQIVAVGVRGTWEWEERGHRYVKVVD